METSVSQPDATQEQAISIRPKRVVAEMSAYHPPLEGRRERTRLDFNEHPTGYGELTGLPVHQSAMYPEYDRFCVTLAQAWGLPGPEWLLITNGSDEALNVIPHTFIEPGEDVALTSLPTFPIIPHAIKLSGAKLIQVPLAAGFQYDEAALEAAIAAHQPKLVTLASPDNPTGAYLPLETLARWCGQFPNTLFVLDEAYGEYTGESGLPLVKTYANLLVSKTFSKAYGLAGLRLGVIVGNPGLMGPMRIVRSPYSVNTVALDAASKLLGAREQVVADARATMARKPALAGDLRELGYTVHEGAGNFVLLFAGLEAGLLSEFCARQGVLVRNRSVGQGPADHPMWGWVRISLGTSEQHARLIETLKAFRRETALIFDLDDTLIDTTQSFDAIVADLVQHYTGQPLDVDELHRLRVQGGYNDDWAATEALLKQRGVTHLNLDTLAEEGRRRYLDIAKEVEALHVDADNWLRPLAKRHRLFIVTGRCREEYDPIWHSQLSPCFEAVYCVDNLPGCKLKPSPDSLLYVMHEHGLSQGTYVGNSVDDMKAARGAGMLAVGVAHTQPKEALLAAGAHYVVDHVNDIKQYLEPCS